MQNSTKNNQDHTNNPFKATSIVGNRSADRHAKIMQVRKDLNLNPNVKHGPHNFPLKFKNDVDVKNFMKKYGFKDGENINNLLEYLNYYADNSPNINNSSNIS